MRNTPTQHSTQQEVARSVTIEQPTFYSVAQVARILGTSAMTVYRAIADGQFPAVRIRGRLIVPARVIDAMADAAVEDQAVAGGPGRAVQR